MNVVVWLKQKPVVATLKNCTDNLKSLKTDANAKPVYIVKKDRL